MPADVRLKPLLGLEPKSWLTGIYGLLLLIVLFGFALAPALVSPGTVLTVESSPSGATVQWNGEVHGITPLTVFLPAGSSTLEVRRPGFVPSAHTYTSDGSLLKNLFSPHRDSVTVRLVPRSSTSLIEQAAQSIGQWAMTAPSEPDHPIPPLFVPLVSDLSSTGASPSEIKTVLRSFRALVVDHRMYVDYGRAWGLWDVEPPTSLDAQARLWDGVLNPGQVSPLRVFWLLACQSPEVRQRILSSGDAEFQAAKEAWQTATATQPEGPEPAAPASVNTPLGVFRGITEGWSYWGRSTQPTGLPTQDPWRVPVLTQTPRFWLAETAVTPAQLAPFFAAHPEWKPVSGLLTWTGATALAEWLNAQPGRPASFHYVLPTEQEWEAAMRANPTLWASVQGRWEWTASAWGPADYLVANDGDPASMAPSFARTAKGGRALWGRAGLPVTQTSPTLGVRLALKTSIPEKTP